MATLGSGKLFGMGAGSGRAQQRAFSAVADTRVDMFQLSRADVRTHLPADSEVLALWTADAGAGAEGGASTERAVKCVRAFVWGLTRSSGTFRGTVNPEPEHRKPMLFVAHVHTFMPPLL